jgi:threonine dehydratase
MSNPIFIPTLADIIATRARIDPYIVETPVWPWRGREIQTAIGPETTVFAKLELFQHTGTFKPRGALSVMLDLPADALERGVTAVSAGNHAIATAYAAAILGTTAKVVMPRTANPGRVAKCRAYGGEVVLVDDVHVAFDEVKRIEQEEGRTFVHPFEGEAVAMGTATVGLEWLEQVSEMGETLDAVIVPVGGGGLCAGISTAVKLLRPDCTVYAVEPEGADTMHRSFAAGTPQSIDKVRTMADSLGAPYALPYSFELCHRHVDKLVRIDDEQMRQAMKLLYDDLKLVVEPAGAAATAALCGPLRERLHGKRVGVIVCGSNIDLAGYFDIINK